ncbi:DNA cytosine methyltransferase [Campylobacter insulaenigrae]|uniref:Cytosine-specific methyltransferase n=1 Tax=Campylobacter insulaenigrae TaxID=260714 RepID=A0ABY3G6H3_9BACT|nr:DNA cytosine methyltransferase [Campylobacter insulaenigrae]MCR6584785.1 DNA cytosine methyltransferase [Campylobacter insulaenigrae]TWO27897.1 DNA cytosine methyltransferase [Campylobacter insulaenigrae]
MKKEMVAIDLFCGAGGLTRGFLDAGVKVLAGIDFDCDAKKTYEFNNQVPYIQEDIRNISVKRIKEIFSQSKKSIKVLAGCAPCQPFSNINKKEITTDYRRTLLDEFGRLINGVKPHIVLMENVPGIAKKSSDVLERFLYILDKNGYKYDFKVLNAKNFGVPQNRNRFILLASRLKNFTPKLQNQTTSTIKTPRDCIAHLENIKAGQRSKKDYLHFASNMNEINLYRIQNTPKNGGTRMDWGENVPKLECHKKTKGYKDAYSRIWWDKPAPTITTKFYQYCSGRHGHPEQDRALSLREGALLQTFPEHYQFFGNIATIARQIGNAVPPVMNREIVKITLDFSKQNLHT